jgi:hypothetical protein
LRFSENGDFFTVIASALDDELEINFRRMKIIVPMGQLSIGNFY